MREDSPPPPPIKGGRKRIDWRQAFNGIIFRMRTDCQWNQIPKKFGDDSSIHRGFQRLNKHGVMEKIWASLVSDCEELGAVQGPNPTDRGKNGAKRSLIVDEVGGLLGAAIAGANVHDTKLLEATIEAIFVDRPKPTEEKPQSLCLDKGYDNPTGRSAAAAKGQTTHIRRIGEERSVKREKKAQAKAFGSGADAFVALEMSCNSGPIRQELVQLPWPDSTCVWIAVEA